MSHPPPMIDVAVFSPGRLRPLTRADANAFRSKIASMDQADLGLLEVRRFYERRGAS